MLPDQRAVGVDCIGVDVDQSIRIPPRAAIERRRIDLHAREVLLIPLLQRAGGIKVIGTPAEPDCTGALSLSRGKDRRKQTCNYQTCEYMFWTDQNHFS